uniref:potassium channel family protein n=1 Tax=Rheinheimera sp. TaxID=1869214 RepID=UPI004048C3F8
MMMKLYKLVSAYGESPGKVLLTSFFFIVACAVIYRFTGVNGINGCKDIQISDAFYYSVVTFSTLGYGDITPCNLASKFTASIQAIIGLVLTSLFIVTFVRRFHR